MEARRDRAGVAVAVVALLALASGSCGSPAPRPLSSPAAVRPGVVREAGSPVAPPPPRLGPAESPPPTRVGRAESPPPKPPRDPQRDQKAAEQEVRTTAPLRPDFLDVQIHGDWAFVQVAEQGPDGEWDSATMGLLARKSEGWRVVTWSDASEWQPWRKQMSPEVRGELDRWVGE